MPSHDMDRLRTLAVFRDPYTRRMGKLLAALNNWFDRQLMRDQMDHHCEHQPIGVCHLEECELTVMAERW